MTVKEAGSISETIEFPAALTIVGNVVVLLWIILDSFGLLLSSQSQAVGWLFLFVAVVAIYGVLKFIGCFRPCYNCKRCTRGFGRISALYFGNRSLKDPKESYGVPAAIFFFALLGPFPTAVLLVSSIRAFSALKGLILISLVAISVYSGLTWRKASQKT